MRIRNMLPALAAMSIVFLSPNVFSQGEIKRCQVPAGGVQKKLSVYLPEGYGDSGLSYPVLYLIHGSEGDDMTFLGGGYDGHMADANASVIVDRLVQERKVRPLIVACPAMGHDEDLPKYFVPFVDATFRTIPKRESRAIAGHSMGGYTALYVSLAHPETFGIAGGFSSWGLSETTFGELIRTHDLRSNPILFWLYAGTNDQYGVTYPNRYFAKFLSANGLATTYVEDNGDHDRMVAEKLTEFIEYLSERLKW